MQRQPVHTRPRSLLWHLWAWAMLAVGLVWVSLCLAAYVTGMDEADEILDGQLHAAAVLLLQDPIRAEAPHAPSGLTTTMKAPVPTRYAPPLRAVQWEDARVMSDPHGLARHLAGLGAGYHTVSLGDQDGARWRTLVVTRHDGLGHGHRVAVLVDRSHRAELAMDIAVDVAAPVILLLPLVAGALWWAMRRGLKPLQALSGRIAALDLNAGDTLPAPQPFRELNHTASAINALVQRLQTQVDRERRFASDVAHELRTPLAALVWQSRRARHADTHIDQQAALQQLEHDALRAGHTLQQLLDLARAQLGSGQRTTPVDLVALAREVVAEHVPAAHASGHELGLNTQGDTLTAACNAPLLRLALRNLVDNALGHTPAGTRVEVEVLQGMDGDVSVAVCNTGAPDGHAAKPPSTGMGIGLTLVQRIADSQGIELVCGAAPPPFVTRWALVWPPHRAGSQAG